MSERFLNERSIYDTFDDYFLGDSDNTDYAQGNTPPIGTNHVASLILAEAVRENPVHPRGFASFGVTQRGVQADPTRQVQSLPDVQFNVGRRHVNLEVDGTGEINTHTADHLRAMQAAVDAGLVNARNIANAARSVFTTAGSDGRIREIKHVHYELQNGRVVPVEDAHIRLNTPLTAQQAWNQRILQNANAANRLNTRQQSAAHRNRQRAVIQTRNNRPNRQPLRPNVLRTRQPVSGRRNNRINRFEETDAFFDHLIDDYLLG